MNTKKANPFDPKYLIDATDDQISFVDTSYCYRAVNMAYVRMLDLPKEAIIGRFIWEIVSPETFESVIKPRIDVAFGGRETLYEAWFPLPNDKRVFFAIRYRPLLDEHGTVVGVAVTAHDRTIQKVQELQLERYEKQLIELSRMAQQGDLSALLSHQWRTPLHQLSTYLLRLRQKPDEVAILDACDTIIETLSTMIEDLLPHPKPLVDSAMRLETSVLRALELLKHRIELEHIDVSVRIPSDCMLKTHSSSFVHLFVVFIENAIEALTHQNQSQRTLSIGATSKPHETRIDIIDNGCGIEPHMAAELFQAGLSSKPDEGHGFGLFLAHKIITQQLQGSVTLLPTKEGAHFQIRLPHIDS